MLHARLPRLPPKLKPSTLPLTQHSCLPIQLDRHLPKQQASIVPPIRWPVARVLAPSCRKGLIPVKNMVLFMTTVIIVIKVTVLTTDRPPSPRSRCRPPLSKASPLPDAARPSTSTNLPSTGGQGNIPIRTGRDCYKGSWWKQRGSGRKDYMLLRLVKLVRGMGW